MGRHSISFITNFLLRIRNRHFFAIDFLVLLFTPMAALYLRLGSTDAFSELASSLVLLTISFLIVKLAFFYLLSLYRRYWRYASVDELARIALAIGASLAVEFGLFISFERLQLIATEFPGSVLLTESLLAFIAVGGSRFSVRFAYRIRYRSGPVGERVPVLIVGAGEAGALIASEMQANATLGMWPAVFVDDDPDKHGLQIHGVTIEGDSTAIRSLAIKYSLKHAVIALPSATGKAIRRVHDICTESGLETRTIPGISELLDGSVEVSELRPVKIEDLLRREPVRVQEEEISETIRGKRILVTGGGGSIGGELCRQIIQYGPASLVLLDHSENAVFEMLLELDAYKNRLESSCDVVGNIGDIRDVKRLEQIFEACLPEIVFHAAAHKHVPLLEENICEAVSNNVLGTLNVIRACERFDVLRLVMLSTDKAVNPTSVMGATKRVAELLVRQTATRKNLPYVSVRFGNVLGSRGSVVPRFQQQIEAGGPVTVTDADVERFFMSIPEAAQLVLQASALAECGEVYVLNMGDPIKIIDLAEDLIRLSGLEPDVDISIEITGLREGEKVSEELFLPSESPRPTRHEKVLVTQIDDALIIDLETDVSDLLISAEKGDRYDILKSINRIVPEYVQGATEPESTSSLVEIVADTTEVLAWPGK